MFIVFSGDVYFSLWNIPILFRRCCDFDPMGVSIFPYLGDFLLLNCGKSTNRAYVGVDYNPIIWCCCGVPHCYRGAIRYPEFWDVDLLGVLFFKIMPFCGCTLTCTDQNLIISLIL